MSAIPVAEWARSPPRPGSRWERVADSYSGVRVGLLLGTGLDFDVCGGGFGFAFDDRAGDGGFGDIDSGEGLNDRAVTHEMRFAAESGGFLRLRGHDDDPGAVGR